MGEDGYVGQRCGVDCVGVRALFRLSMLPRRLRMGFVMRQDAEYGAEYDGRWDVTGSRSAIQDTNVGQEGQVVILPGGV